MYDRAKKFLIFALSCVISLHLLARPIHASEGALSLEEAVSQALDKSPELAVERHQIDVAKGDLAKARVYPLNPDLRLAPSYGSARPREVDTRVGTNGFEVAVSQTLQIKGQWGLRIQRAEADLDRTGWTVKDAQRRIRADVTSLFSDVLIGQERVQFFDEIVVLNRELFDISRQLFEAGSVPRLDMLRADVEWRRAQNDRMAEERVLAAARKELNLLIGRPSDFVPQALGPLRYAFDETDLPALKRIAVANRPDLSAAHARLQVIEQELAIARAERLFPELSASVGYSNDLGLDGRDQRVLFGVTVPLPLWNRRQGEVETALAERSRQAAAVTLVAARIDKEVAQAYERLVASRRIVEEFGKRIVPQQEENFRLLREGYEAGQFPLTEVLLGQREFVEGRLRYLEAVSQYNLSAVELERAVGTPLLKAGPTP
ncbi:MAG: TolC family protein [candidate division NC10 bacterium]|nr:TolC family protein [candidate division NC10 bacterium]MDE2322463.1 TolC family protein [candidate division NC10 bacterium]